MTVEIGGLVTSYNSPANNNYDTPTNPLITFNPVLSAGNRIFSLVLSSGAATPAAARFDEIVSGADLLTEYSNLHATDGFSIRCFDAFKNVGIDLATVDLSTNDYFVLIHSDNENMHHFAKITQITGVGADQDGDKFHFSPRLGSEIAKDVKFMLFKGPSTTTNLIAITAGIKTEVSKLVCARPHFYFYDDKLDTAGELDHNDKYFIRTKTLANTSTDSSILLNTGGDNTTFTTISDYRNKIVDYSRFNYSITLKDELKELDDPDVGTSNESSVLSGTFTTLTDYNDCFINAKRDTDDDVSAKVFSGNKRYVYYNDSPEINNHMSNVYEAEIEDSFDKAGLAEISILDTTKNLTNRVAVDDRLSAYQRLQEDDLREWVEVAEIDSLHTSPRTYTLTQLKERPNLFFVANMEIKVGTRICIIDSVASTDRIVLKADSRLETESAFTSTTSLSGFSQGDKIYRRRLSHLDSTYVTSASFEESKLGRMSGLVQASSYPVKYCSIGSLITNANDDYGLLTISFGNNILDSTSGLERIQGNFVLYYEVFYGAIDQIERRLSEGQTFLDISGRNTLAKLVDVILNKDTNFSSDIIYSSQSPHNKIATTGKTATWDFDSYNITFSTTTNLALNTHLWCDYGYIGQIESVVLTGVTYKLHDYPYTRAESNTTVYQETEKLYVLNKALSANKSVTSVTSLTGTSDKGFYFKDGIKLTGDFDALVDGDTLVGTSDDTNAEAVGYNIDSVKNIDDDLDFNLEIDGLTEDIVNTLIDFTILSVKGDNIKTVKLAPYMPLTLGREKVNHSITPDSFTNLAQVSTTSLDNEVTCSASTFTNYSLPIGEKIYANGSFVGIYLGNAFVASDSTITDVKIFLDRNLPSNLNGTYLQINGGRKKRAFMFTNGAHLHGSKIVNMLGPNNLPVDYSLTGTSVYSVAVTEKSLKQKFGADILRLTNVEKGRVGESKSYLLTQDTDKGRRNAYYGDEGIYLYYAEAYQGHPNNLTIDSKTGTTNNNHYAISTRGHRPIIGSAYADRQFISAVDEGTVYRSPEPDVRLGSATIDNYPNPLDARDKFYQIDAKAGRLFLFCNSDRFLYSSTRKDSLMVAKASDDAANSFLQSQGMLSIAEPRKTDSSSTKDEFVGETKTITNLDEDYRHSSIISSNKVLSGLKRFGLMRLTDVVYDWAFNPINPEFNVPDDRVVESPTVFFHEKTQVKNGATALTIAAVDNTGIQMNNTITNVSVGDFILDPTYLGIVGVVSSITTVTNSNDKLNFTFYRAYGGSRLNIGDNVYFFPHERLDETMRVIGKQEGGDIYFEATGDGVAGSNIHMLKGVVTNDDDPSTWTDYYTPSNVTMGSGFPKLQKGTGHQKQSILLPISFEGIFRDVSALGFGGHTFDEAFYTFGFNHASGSPNTLGSFSVNRDFSRSGYGSSELFNFYNGFDDGNGTTSVNDDIAALKLVFLKPYNIEEDTTEHGITSPFLHQGTTASTYHSPADDLSGRFQSHIFYNTLETFATQTNTAAGTYLGFKPHLHTPSGLTTTDVKSINNTTLKRCSIDLTDLRFILQFMDLTGCYLVPAEKGKYYDGNDVASGSSINSNHQVTIDDNEIIYVVSHEYDLTKAAGNPSCVLITDEALAANTKYKIMQPNPICFWENSPNTIRLNTLDKGYTKKMDSDDMYDTFPSFASNEKAGTRDQTCNLEGVQSMYVMVDIDNLSGEEKTIVKTATGRETILANFDGNYCVSDGETSFDTEIVGKDAGDDIGHYLTISDKGKMNGVVSISETFELKVSGSVTPDEKRAVIGSSISIARESEDIVEEVLTENDITFSLTKEDYKVVVSPNFQGLNLFAITNYFLALKNKKMINVTGTIQIENLDADDFISKYTFDDDNITDIEITKSNFDYYNHITVYGQNHKETRKDFREIKKRGKKSLEVFNSKLATQEDVTKEAHNLLKAHTSLNNIVSFKVNNSDAGTIGIGDIVSVESRFVGIERNQYVVLEAIHNFSGMVELRVGRYFNGLEDIFANILVTSSQTNSYLRQSEYNENENDYDFMAEINVEEIYFLARKRNISGAFTLGFGTALNTGTTPLGFGGGSITYTRLLEENL
jgi:hypothetical protein